MKLKYIFMSILLCSTNIFAATVPLYRIDLSPYDKNMYDANGNLINGNGNGNGSNNNGGNTGGGETGGGGEENNLPNPECGSANGQTFVNGSPPVNPNLCNIGTATVPYGGGEKYYWSCETPVPNNETMTTQCEANRTIVTTDYSSCDEYRLDSGQTQSGVYLLTIGGQQINVYCDMVSYGGGWMLVTAQKELTPVGWGDGVNAAYNPLTDSFSFNESQLPSGRYQVAFGSNIGSPFIMFGDFVYTTGNIAKQEILSRIGTNQRFHIHRNSSEGYYQHNPDEFGTGNLNDLNNTLTVDRRSTLGRNWAFSPNAITEAERGYYLGGSNLSYSNDSNLWTIWVR